MISVKTIFEESCDRLLKMYPGREAESVCFILFEDLLGVNKVDILTDKTRSLDADALNQAMDRLLNHEPVQYVTGRADFFGRQFLVTPDVLIPRPETEELVQLILKDARENSRMLDVGTGSGCIAIALSLATKAEVYGLDVSDGALAVAEKNAKHLGAGVTFVKGDVLSEELPVNDLDVLVSNPPYILKEEAVAMRKNVIDHEPALALFTPDRDPLVFYRRIAELGRSAIKPGGKIFFEINEAYGTEVKELLAGLGYGSAAVHKDLSGKDRMVVASNQSLAATYDDTFE